MKKITLLALACAMFMAPSAATAQEVVYVEDPAQGYTFNRFQDNWFIEALGGAGIMMSKYDAKAKFGDRLGWKANLVVGKWFSPLLGLRFGAEFNQMKGVADNNYAAIGVRKDKKMVDGLYQQHFNNIGGFADAMLNVTNWWCGYRPGRFYNGIVYGGFGVHWGFSKTNYGLPNGNQKSTWEYAGTKKQSGEKRYERNFSARAGLLNTFRLSEHVNLLLDLRFEIMQEHVDGHGNRTWNEYPSALLGLSYRFNKTEWTAPIVPVCPTYKYTDDEGDALVARLEAANRKIRDLEAQLAGCNKPAPVPPTPVETDAPLATVYYPINVSKIVGVQNDVVNAVAGVMLEENKNYKLTGWADNYTGNDKINTRLRKDRVAGVKKALMDKGVAESRLSTEIDDRNRPEVDFGPKSAPLSRAVTIYRKK